MEELCRELGDRGKAAVGAGSLSLDSDACGDQALSSLLLNDSEGARTSALEECLASAASALQSFGRKKSKALMLRTDGLLDQLADADEGDAAAWVGAEWASEHAEAVTEAMEQMRVLVGGSSSRQAVDVASTVTALLEALELVVASHVDTAEALRAALHSDGDHEAVVSVVEHGLAVLEALALSSPRKQRKAVDGMCERVEPVLEDLDGMLQLLSTCAPSELESLVQCLCEVSGLRVGEAGAECMETVGAALEELTVDH